MAELITNEQLAEIVLSPEMAQDDAGSIRSHPLKDVLAAMEFAEKRQTTKRLRPFGGAVAVTAVMPGAVGPCSE